MREPASLRGSVPVLDVRRDRHYSAGNQLLCGLAPLLIPALAVNADQYLTAALIRMVSVPVVPAARLERHVCYENGLLRVGQRLQVGIPLEVLSIGCVGFALTEESAVLLCDVVRVDLLCLTECRQAFGQPA